MDETARADAICRILKTTFPDVKTQLRHHNPFELLIATILAAQCTDRQVNAVTGPLFAAYPTPEAHRGSAPGWYVSPLRGWAVPALCPFP